MRGPEGKGTVRGICILWDFRRAIRLIAVFIILLGAMSSCAAPQSSQQLRIFNSGTKDLKGLSVLFPGPTADSQAIRVNFGDVPAGTSTSYQSVPSGVYRYAAYEYTLDGREISQPVVDWVGEKPMEGTQFTYEVQLDLEKPTGAQIQLVAVTVNAH